MNRYKQWIKQSLLIVMLVIPAFANALPPKRQHSTGDVTIVAHPTGKHLYEFTAGQYAYYFLWDYGPVEMIVHAIHGYDDQGNRVATSPTEIRHLDPYSQRFAEIRSEPEATLKFIGNGTPRYASTAPKIRVPDLFYREKTITHVSVEFSVVDGRMSVGPWLSMLTDWGNESSVRDHIEMILW